MDSYRTLRIYGHRTPEARYTVKVNGEIVDNGLDELFSFITNTKLHGSYNIDICVQSGIITLTNCTATYPAIFNNVEGTATVDQPIAEPVAVISNGEIKTIPFEIKIKEGEQFIYEHLMLNGPNRFKIAIEGKDLFPGIHVYIGDFIKNKFIQGISNIQAEYEYEKQPNEINSIEDLEKLKAIVLANILF